MASNLRQRRPDTTVNPPHKPSDIEAEPTNKTTLSILDILRLLAGLALLNCSLSYFITSDEFFWGYRPLWYSQPRVFMSWLRGPIYLTDAELALYNGTDPSSPIYLALNGTIYDVTAGRRIYGPGGSYELLAAKDAARSYVTGCFAEDGTPDLRGVEWTYVPEDVPGFDDDSSGDGGGVKVDAAMKVYREAELRKARKKVAEAIEEWAEVFSGRTGKEYFEVGKVRREEGWLEKLPRRRLCEAARRKRPKVKP